MASTTEVEIAKDQATATTATADATNADTKMICDACSKPGDNLLCCARCKQAWYHDKKCQVDHFPHHKAKCRQLVAAAKANGSAVTASNNLPKIPDIATVDDEGQVTLADGIEVIDTKDLGKACIATKAFSTGDMVLLEPPAVVFDERSGYMGLFQAFLKATSATQEKILQMYRPDEELLKTSMDEKRKKIRTKRKQLLVQQYSQFIQANPQHKEALPLSIADQLIGIIDANAHAFQIHHTVDLVATSTNKGVPLSYHALFTLGSRVEHSCSPNLTFITKGGKLEYIAEMQIQPQDRLSISYLGSVYERPRKQRRVFLKENKTFICTCTRCLGWDECSPLRCNCPNNISSNGIMFHSGARDQWECQMCDRKVPTKDCPNDDHLSSQLRGEADLYAKVRRYQHILQSQPYPELLDEILELVRKPKWSKIIHPLHWMNVEVYKLISSVATSAARYYAIDNNNTSNINSKIQNNNHKPEKAPPLLRLSALAILRRIIWMGRIAAIDRGLLTLTEAVEASSTEDYSVFSPHSVRYEDVEAVVNDLCDNPQNSLLKELGTLGVSSAFHAGQDLIIAGHKDLALKLYKRYEKSFQDWKGVSDQSRTKVMAFLESNGEDNQFDNFLMQ